MQRPGESLSVEDLQALEAQADVRPADDVDIDEWLTEQAAAAKEFGEVVIEGKRIKVAPITEGEENKLLRQARRPDPRNPREQKTDIMAYRRSYVALSLSKAYGRSVLPEDPRILGMLPGVLTKLQTTINELSKYEVPERQYDPFSSLT